MSLPDEIRKFVLIRYILPARDRNEDTVTLSASIIQQAMGNEIPIDKICKAIDTRSFLDLATVTLIRREGPPKGANAQWTFGVSMRHQRGEVLVAVVKRKSDLAILKGEGWYRVPVNAAPRRWPPKWIAFYQGAQWGEEHGINYYAPVVNIQRALRHELFPKEPLNPKSNKAYYQIFFGPLQSIEPPLVSRRPRVIIFIPTTWPKFITAEEINDLYDDSPLEDLLWTEFKRLTIPVERQWRVQVQKKHYYLDFALFCKDANVAIEADGDSWHGDRPQNVADKRRQNDLTTVGWHILRFDTQQIHEEMTTYCIPKVKAAIHQYRGAVNERGVSHRLYTFPQGDWQQLTLFEATAEYDLD